MTIYITVHVRDTFARQAYTGGFSLLIAVIYEQLTRNKGGAVAAELQETSKIITVGLEHLLLCIPLTSLATQGLAGICCCCGYGHHRW